MSDRRITAMEHEVACLAEHARIAVENHARAVRRLAFLRAAVPAQRSGAVASDPRPATAPVATTT